MMIPDPKIRRSLVLASAGTGALLFSACFVQGSIRPRKPGPAFPPGARAFLNKTCVPCHSGASPSGRLNLSTAPFHSDDPNNVALWVKVHDRVSKGEMPPVHAAQPTPQARQSFLAALARPVREAQAALDRREGRAVWRRMNRYEYENTLRDLLGAPWLQVKEMLPEDGLAYRFNKVGDALDISHVQMSRYLAAADYALRQAMIPRATRPENTTTRYYAREQRSFAGLVKAGFAYTGASARGTFPILDNAADLPVIDGSGPMTVGSADPAKREIEALGVVASSYEPIQPRFDRFHAPISGKYILRLRSHTFWAGPLNEKVWWHADQKKISAGRTLEPVTLYASSPPQILRRLGTVDSAPESATREMEVVLLKGETIMPDAARLFRSRPPDPNDPNAKRGVSGWRSPLAKKDGQPGVAFQWLEVTGPVLESWPTPGQRLLFGDLPVKEDAAHKSVEVVPANPQADAERLVRAFVKRALRRPATEEDVHPFVKLAQNALASGVSFTDSIIAAYSAVLCSPQFVTLQERPGPLDDYALAERLSYFLWNSEPDETLRALADQKKLHDPGVLSAQADRMIGDPRSQQFVDAFLDYWLDLRKTDNTSPDANLYPDYYLDDLLAESAVDETRGFFAELVRKDLQARNVVSSDFVMVNSRLAELYGIPDVKGAAIRRVELPKDSVRGGLLTQASVLKVTANGTTTSPVLRGVWINERILGNQVPPPPPNLPAIDPDIRGATTIREQLDKHRSQAVCKSCHKMIDPPGFALESFDVYGAFRDHYRALGPGETVPGFGKNGQPFPFHLGKPVDCSGALQDGRPFQDVRELKRLILQDERQIARNLVRQLVTYSTGAPVRFADRPAVEAILDRAKPGGYGVKSLIHGIVQSELFRNK